MNNKKVWNRIEKSVKPTSEKENKYTHGVVSILARYPGMIPSRSKMETDMNFHDIEHFGTLKSSKAYIKKMKSAERRQFKAQYPDDKYSNFGHFNYKTVRLTKKEREHALKTNGGK